jgi:hypothetical protein
MPKDTVSDPITDQEMAFAHLVLSGTMNDRRAAEAVGLNPDTAAYTKAKPRVRDYMTEHRAAAVSERLVDQEAEGLRQLNFGRDQILTRLWELATLPSEATRGSIAGQIKALSMIVAIEGLIAGRHSPPQNQPAASPVKAQIYSPECRCGQKHQAQSPQPDDEPGDAAAAVEAQPGAPQAPEPQAPPQPAPMLANYAPSPNLDRNRLCLTATRILQEALNRVPLANAGIFDAALDTTSPFRLPSYPQIDPPARCR